MRTRRILAAQVGAIGVASGFTVGQTVAGADTAISVTRDESVVWVEVGVFDDSADDVGIRIFSGGRLYQRSWLPYSGPGTYRCGIDRKAAARIGGRWLARAFLDDAEVARKRFVIKR
jgi:hypothetical protein